MDRSIRVAYRSAATSTFQPLPPVHIRGADAHRRRDAHDGFSTCLVPTQCRAVLRGRRSRDVARGAGPGARMVHALACAHIRALLSARQNPRHPEHPGSSSRVVPGDPVSQRARGLRNGCPPSEISTPRVRGAGNHCAADRR